MAKDSGRIRGAASVTGSIFRGAAANARKPVEVARAGGRSLLKLPRFLGAAGRASARKTSKSVKNTGKRWRRD